MSIYRIYAGADGESHIEEVHVAQHAELARWCMSRRSGSTSLLSCGPWTSTR